MGLSSVPVDVLASIALWLFGALIACLLWFALRVVSQLDKISDSLTAEIHRHDLRIAKLESWRDGLRFPKEDMDRRSADRQADD